MAEALSLAAEEIGQTATLIWGGISVAAKLNYEVMSYVVASTSKIVQLLLLLTHKASDVLTIITNDILLFLGDIGNGAFAFGKTLQTLVIGISYAIQAIGYSCYAAFIHILTVSGSLYSGVIENVVFIFEQLGRLMYFIKHVFILFGSSTLFAISFIPNLIHLLCTSMFSLLSLAKSSIAKVFFGIYIQFCSTCNDIADSVISYFKDIPLSALFGTFIGILVILCLKLITKYMIEHLIIPHFTISSFFEALRNSLFSKFNYICQRLTFSLGQNVPNDVNDNEDNLNVHHVNNEAREAGPPNIIMEHDPRTEADHIHTFVPDVPQLIRRPISRRQRVLGLANTVTEDEVLKLNGGYQSKKKVTVEDKKYANTEWMKQLYRELEEERENQLCVICQDKPKRIILLPCRHLCLCDSCRSAIITRGNNCPICRRQITETLRVYL